MRFPSISSLAIAIAALAAFLLGTPTYASETNLLQNGTFDSALTKWTTSKGPSTSTGTVTVESGSCHSGSCVKMSKGDSTTLSLYQTMGNLIIGQWYKVSGYFKTTPTHYGFIALRDSTWNATCDKPKGKSFSHQIQGTNTWQPISVPVLIPAVDDCGAAENKRSAYV